MSAAFSEALLTPGLIWLVAAVFVAGLVRGFSGFGTAMVYMPVAGTVLSPVWALMTMLVFDLFGPLPNVPRAIRESNSKETILLAIGATVTLPLGIWVLTRTDPEVFRWSVSIATLMLLALLLSGWRYSGKIDLPKSIAIGGTSGFLGGVIGIAGPPVILLYMSSSRAVAAIRANILIYLLFVDVLALGVFGLSGLLMPTPVIIGLILAIPYTLGNIAGGMIFNPEKDRTYRRIAYAIIAVSAINGLPIFG